IAGTTPWYPSTVAAGKNPATIELVEDRCTGAADCVQVCPREVLRMNGQRRKVEITKPEQCIQCGACIVQCPDDALRFRYRDGSVVEADVIRRTRMNMLGKRKEMLR
ncbi:MAG: 4Fe-4S dicluster domain-containing protein, partial [Myxococcales bacterium]|nr:4Fe-4S dicluster domain-containing protein [Myxococcales bacterium]